MRRTAFEIEKGIGVGVPIKGVDRDQLEKLLTKPWTADGKTFSERIWSDMDALIGTLSDTLTRSVALGETPDRVINALTDRFNVEKRKAARLVYTESAFFSAAARKDCYDELGVERYEIVASLDEITCPVCGKLDGKVFDRKDYMPGSTANPFHPNCRCTTAPYFEDMNGVGERFSRDVGTGEAEMVPAGTTYEKWREEQDKKYGAGTVDKRRKMVYNESADRKQYKEHRKVLSKNAPESFEKFQSIKYSDEWRDYNNYKKAVVKGELSALADFDLYQETSRQIDSVLVGVTTENGIVIKDKSYHFIARTIGSIEQKRNGVPIEDTLFALTKPTSIGSVTESNGVRSQKFTGKKCQVSVNPDTGVLIQVNPYKERKRKK